MKNSIAYILQIHKNPKQINKFIKQLITNDLADVYIHIDRKNFDSISKQIIKHKNVFILNESIDIKWGDISQIDATILLFKNVICSGIDYDFVCLRSGQDLLVKNGFGEYLYNNPASIFMSAQLINRNTCDAAFHNVKWFALMRNQYPYYHPIRILRKIIITMYGRGINLVPNRYALPKGYSLFHGSQWFCMPLEVVRYIVDFLKENKSFYESFRNSLCPDEWFFQTLIMNSNYKENVVNSNLMFIKWGMELKNNSSPVVLKYSDINSIIDSNNFFARKFDENIDKEVINYFVSRVKM